MLFTLRVTGPHASDLEVLLDKCPDELHSTSLPFGRAFVFFPEVSPDAVTVALVVDTDAVRWSSNGSPGRFAMTNSAMLSVAISRMFGTALAARAPRRPELVTSILPIEACVSSFAVTRGSTDARALFAPLGYDVTIYEADQNASETSVRHSVRLTKLAPLYEVLSHVYVLGPVIDGHASDRVLDGEREALIVHAEGSVRGHSAGDRIMQAHAARRISGTAAAFERLAEAEVLPGQTSLGGPLAPTFLDETRSEAIVLELREAAAHSVLDLGCGDGKLLARLVREKALTRIVGMDVSHRALDAAATRMKLDRKGGKKSERLDLLHGSLFYTDARLSGYDAAVLADVVQHVPAERLGDVEKAVFQDARPATIVVLLSNPYREESESNVQHRWSSKQFDSWASGVSAQSGYRLRLLSPGSSQHATRMAVFSR